ncbi:MAG: WecB/TagA/CpsF family glycosyltransferase [Candidatus Bathyarchaeota archaeon]|nr:WecB/TagA/CpsF family glycosyltransferase [Candidatus Bathyarchaeota archaeon]
MLGQRIKIMGLNIDSLTIEETIIIIEETIKKKLKCQHVVLNAGKMVLAYKNEKLKGIINNCQIINADGQAVVWASKLLGKPLPERVAGVDLMNNLIKVSAAKGYKIYLFGAKEEVVTRVVDVLKEDNPLLKIAGYRNGYFSEVENFEIIRDMNKSKADILFIGFSSPKKEYWLEQNINKIDIPFCMGVGGSFDIVASVTKRAPKWMQQLGLEWFFRFIQEPKRMWKRYLLGNTKFIYYILREKLIFLKRKI